jgi:trehalose-phosphatase
MMKTLAREFRRGLSDVPGALVEDKGLTVALHFRRVPERCRRLFGERVQGFKRRTAGLPVFWRAGLKVRELLPRVAWHKGRAALHLKSLLGHPWPVAVGDEVTDEDMFRAVRGRGLAIRVGRGSSAAPYRLRRQREVPRLLAELASLPGGPR